MVELKEKTVEELRKMASRKKIEGRSSMNKAQLVRALQKCTTTKKRKMKGGALTPNDLDDLVRRNYTENPLYLYDISGRETRQGWIQSAHRGGPLANHPRGVVILVLPETYQNYQRVGNTSIHIRTRHFLDQIFFPENYSFITHNNINYLVGNRRLDLPIPPQRLPIPPQDILNEQLPIPPQV